MLRALAAIACGRLTAAEVERDDELRQLGYLAALGRGRLHAAELEAAVDGFARAAHAALSGKAAPAPARPIDRLQAHWRAPYGLERSKLRAELPAYVRAERRSQPA